MESVRQFPSCPSGKVTSLCSKVQSPKWKAHPFTSSSSPYHRLFRNIVILCKKQSVAHSIVKIIRPYLWSPWLNHMLGTTIAIFRAPGALNMGLPTGPVGNPRLEDKIRNISGGWDLKQLLLSKIIQIHHLSLRFKRSDSWYKELY